VFGRAKFPLAIDIGSYAVKLVQLERRKKGALALKRLGMASLAPGAVAEGSVRDAEEVMRAVEELIAAEKAKEKEVVVALSGTAALLKTMLIPSEPGMPIEEAVEAEASQLLPFPVEEARLTHRRIGRREVDGDVMDEFLVIAVRRKPLSELVDLFRHLDYEPKIVDVNFLALESAFELSGMEREEETAALVDIGAAETLVHVVRDGRTLLTRVIPFGAAAVTDSLAEKLSVTRAEAEAIKVGARPAPSPRLAVEAVRGEAERMARELGRTLQLVRQLPPDGRMDRVVLSGGGANLEGLPAFLAASLDLPVEVVQPFQHVEVAADTFDASYVESLAPIAAIGAGLAYRAVEAA